MAEATWGDWSRARAQRAERVLEATLALHAPAEPGTRSLREAMAYAVLGGGKRMRALLAYAGGELTGAREENVDPVAAAVELMHAYSLVHDDLPCMDDDHLRRGKPSCHVAYGEAMALLAGDALQALAFASLSGAPGARIESLARLAHAAGASGMAGGQAIDLESVGRALPLPELERMHALKTGALIAASIQLGADCGGALGAAERLALDRYGRTLGLAFQIVDDVLDVEGTPEALGKSVGKDAAQNRATFVTLLGVAAARQRIEGLAAEARESIRGFGAPARRLIELGDWIVARQH